MLRVPMIATYHTDFPAYVDKLTGDHRVANGTGAVHEVVLLAGGRVFTRSAAYRFKLMDLGYRRKQDPPAFAGRRSGEVQPALSRLRCFEKLGVKKTRRLLYAGRVSVEKSLPMLVEIFGDCAGCATMSR